MNNKKTEIFKSIEEKIKERAYFIWKNTGSQDKTKNYFEAEQIEKNNVISANIDPLTSKSYPPNIFCLTPKAAKTPIERRAPKRIIIFPVCLGIPESIIII